MQACHRRISNNKPKLSWTETLIKYAAQAGFCDHEILPLENFFFRFYHLKKVCPVDQTQPAVQAASI